MTLFAVMGVVKAPTTPAISRLHADTVVLTSSQLHLNVEGGLEPTELQLIDQALQSRT